MRKLQHFLSLSVTILHPKIRIISQYFTCRITQYFIIGLLDWILPKKTKWFLHETVQKAPSKCKILPEGTCAKWDQCDNYHVWVSPQSVKKIQENFGLLGGGCLKNLLFFSNLLLLRGLATPPSPLSSPVDNLDFSSIF